MRYARSIKYSVLLKRLSRSYGDEGKYSETVYFEDISDRKRFSNE